MARAAEEGHRDAPVCHRALGIVFCDSLERLPCLWVRHVMQQGDRPIEFLLGLFGAGDGKVNPAQRVAGVLLDLAARFARAAPKQNSRQTGAQVKKGRTMSAIY